MKESIKPKYLLLKDNKDHHRSFGSLNSKTTYIRRNVNLFLIKNSSSDFNQTQIFDYKKI